MRRSLFLVGSIFLFLAGLASAEEPLALDKKVLSLAAARKIVAASEAEAKARGLGVVIVVVDDAGNLIQLSRMDDAQVASVNVGIGKARTAAIYRRPSRVFEEQIKNGRIAALALADATPLQGGVPVLIDGKVVREEGMGSSRASHVQASDNRDTLSRLIWVSLECFVAARSPSWVGHSWAARVDETSTRTMRVRLLVRVITAHCRESPSVGQSSRLERNRFRSGDRDLFVRLRRVAADPDRPHDLPADQNRNASLE
ncbi:MAG TPA: heme-binding protein, partial [Vicinamibacteria bacterium]|nr:heme-binding protein [Vicinamibacteria bacterium]